MSIACGQRLPQISSDCAGCMNKLCTGSSAGQQHGEDMGAPGEGGGRGLHTDCAGRHAERQVHVLASSTQMSVSHAQ